MPQRAADLSLRTLCITLLLLFPLTLAAAWWPSTAVISVPANSYTVYFTFDDGPSNTTEKVLDILLDEGISATFFVIGATTEHGMALYNRMLEEGHSLGLHTFSHDVTRIYRSMDGFKNDFAKLEQWILETTGISPKICRMAGGSNSTYCPAVLREQILSHLVEKGYACFDWDVDAKDSGAFTISARELARNVVTAAQKKPEQDLVILLHDDALRTTLPEALRELIDYFRGQGYHFGALHEDTESIKRILPKAAS